MTLSPRFFTPALLATSALLLSACMGSDFANRASFIEAPIQTQQIGFEYQPINLNN